MYVEEPYTNFWQKLRGLYGLELKGSFERKVLAVKLSHVSGQVTANASRV